MQINTILLGVLLVVATALCAVAIWSLLEGVKVARSARVLADDLDSRVVPLLEKADITIDALNAELLRVDSIVSRIEEITDRVESTSRTVQEVANAPAEIVTDIADRVRRAWKRRQAETTAVNDARRAEAPEAKDTPTAPEPADSGEPTTPETAAATMPESEPVPESETAPGDVTSI